MAVDTILRCMLLSVLPVSELRGGIPYGLANGTDLMTAFIVCVVSNMLVIPIVFIFLDTVHQQFYRLRPYRWLFDKWVLRTRMRAEKSVEKWGYWGVMLFVAIPLPVTGAYTGTLAAWLLKLNKVRASLFLALGVVIAGIIVSTASVTGIELLKIFTK